jgi:4-hydroxybenzoate polyprenyltransferase
MTHPPNKSTPLLSWLRLLRISALPSAMSNVLMGYLLANGNWSPPLLLFVLVMTSSLLYLAGMVLNDVFDLEVDNRLRPERPLPSKQIGLSLARMVGFGLLTLGLAGSLVASLIASWIVSGEMALSEPRPFVVGGLLVVFICLYDIFLKRTRWSPIAMGVCRGLNVLLGASTAPASTTDSNWLFGFSSPVWIVALSLGTLIAGVTWLARNETKQSRPFALLPAGVVLLSGITGIALTPQMSGAVFPARIATLFPWLILLIALTIIRRLAIAVFSGKPGDVQNVIIATLQSLIIFDACLCYLAVPDKIFYALAVVSLLVPAVASGRWIRST